LANFVGGACPANAWVVGFLNVLVIRLRSLLLAEADPLKAKWYQQLFIAQGILFAGS
jgi:hypothetical protein